MLGLAIVLFAAGGLCPVFKATELLETVEWASFGYISMGLAGTSLLFDKYYGLSTGWTRYVLTELRLRKSLNDFLDDWDIGTVGLSYSTLSEEKTVELLEKIRIYNSLVFDIVKEETEAWATEFRNNVSELNRLISEEMEKRRSSMADQKKEEVEKKRKEQEKAKKGYAKVIVKNAGSFDKIEVKLADRARTLSAHESVALFSDMPPGTHELLVDGEKSGKKTAARDFAEVKGGEITVKEVDLS